MITSMAVIYQDMAIGDIFFESLKNQIKNEKKVSREKFSVLFDNTNNSNNFLEL